jgi:predicted cupin superfamily sugar epimerase
MSSLSAKKVKEILNLEPLQGEGGWFVQTYAATETIAAGQFGDNRYNGPRSTSTAIYYLLEPDTFSEMHCLTSDEVFHHYLGGAVEMLQLHPDGRTETLLIGPDLEAGQRPQVLVPRGVWQGSRLLQAQGFALLGCTVSPGFEFADYQSAPREELIAKWPDVAELIAKLTRG